MTTFDPVPPNRRATASGSAFDVIVRDGSRSITLQVAVCGIFIIVFVAALSIARPVFLPIAAALVLGLLFGPLQSRLEKLGLPSMLAATVIVGALVGVILFAIRMLVIPFEEWSARLPEIWAAIRRQMYAVRDLVIAVNDATDMMQESAGLGGSGDAETVVVSTQGLLGSIATGVPSVAAQIVLFLGVLFFFLASRARLRIALLSLCFGRKARLRAAHCIADAENAVSTYLTNIAMINAGLAVTTGTILWLLGVPNAFFWGAVAGLVNFFPYIGPAALTILLLGVGLLDEGIGIRPFLPAIVFFTLNFIEANFVTPSILGRNMTVEPMLVIIALAFWLWLWGPVGALLAVPLLVVGQAVVHRLLLRDTVRGPHQPIPKMS